MKYFSSFCYSLTLNWKENTLNIFQIYVPIRGVSRSNRRTIFIRCSCDSRSPLLSLSIKCITKMPIKAHDIKKTNAKHVHRPHFLFTFRLATSFSCAVGVFGLDDLDGSGAFWCVLISNDSEFVDGSRNVSGCLLACSVTSGRPPKQGVWKWNKRKSLISWRCNNVGVER